MHCPFVASARPILHPGFLPPPVVRRWRILDARHRMQVGADVYVLAPTAGTERTLPGAGGSHDTIRVYLYVRSRVTTHNPVCTERTGGVMDEENAAANVSANTAVFSTAHRNPRQSNQTRLCRSIASNIETSKSTRSLISISGTKRIGQGSYTCVHRMRSLFLRSPSRTKRRRRGSFLSG